MKIWRVFLLAAVSWIGQQASAQQVLPPKVCLTWNSKSLPDFPAQVTLTRGKDGLWQGYVILPPQQPAKATGARWGFAFGQGSAFNGCNAALKLNSAHWYACLGSGTWSAAPWFVDLGAGWDGQSNLSGSITNNAASIAVGACK